MRVIPLVRALARARFSLPNRCLCSRTPPAEADVALKHVTKSNFEQALNELRGDVKHADFVSIDLEMTGITSAPWRECFNFDRPDIQYLKIKDSAEKFAVVQFGVCPFRWDSNSNAFIAYPYNFYIFPRQEIPGDGSSSEFLCQTRSQEEEALEQLDSLYKLTLDSSPKLGNDVDAKLIRLADILFSERIKKTLSEWRDALLHKRSRGSEFQGSLNDTKQKFETTFFHRRPALVLNGLSSRQLGMTKMVVGMLKDLAYVHVSSETSPLQHMVVYTDSTADRELLMMEVKARQRQEAEMKIKSAIGFRHVFDLLSSEKKLIVGHNCFLDLAHVFRKFVAPLPETAEEFVSSLQSYFPHIIDTKLLLNTDIELFRLLKSGGTSLSKAFTLLCPPIVLSGAGNVVEDKRVKVEVQVDGQRFSNWNSGSKHEAGYDAFMTGCVFSQACFHLGIDFNSLDLLQHQKLEKYINHLYLSWMSGDIINLKTGNILQDSLGSTNINRRHLPKTIYSNMILLWGLPRTLRTADIKNCLHKAFGAISIASFHHIDETAAFIQFSQPELVSDFLSLKDLLEKDTGPVSVLHPLSNILAGGRVRAARYDTYKKICSSPISETMFADQAAAVGVDAEPGSMETTEVEISSSNEVCEAICLDGDGVSELQSNCISSTDGFVDSFQLSKAAIRT
ncbi:poly(A)-specific ribonuclease PARN isoform X2 [Andrographis paniculata]|uniref:poly(A)-specific ribonuclease PARN isoform X2 n=1 Tax=Andrographis paniculata TaxID=175694 RepID=UPI0021E8E7B1|nr:poly(A)-specific ribonuclease PARN isoform X2 [Andrographis paniculata]